MSVIGIDFGDESCYIAVARQGGIETLDNDYSLRATPSCVAFTGKNRIMGVAAKTQAATNMRNTVMHFKHFIGKKYRDPVVQREVGKLPYEVVETPEGGIGIRVEYQFEQRTFSPTEMTAMLFTKLKLLAEAALGTKVNDVVIGVPIYFDDANRQALLAAAKGAGLNVLRLFNETAATALAYGIYKQDLPAPEETPRNVVFVDCGYSALQVSAVSFNKGKLKVLATTFDENIGGRDFDMVIANHFVEVFKKQYKIDASTNKRAFYKLLTEVEKLKKQMSANSTKLPINIECFMNDKDVSGRLSRPEFEEMAASLLERVEGVLQSCLKESGLAVEGIHSVELVGGSSRVPAIKQLIERVFTRVPSTTLNQDEAVARGCALQCAILSPTFKVREFSIQDVQPYSIRLFWKDDSNNNGDMEVFPKNHPVAFSKILSFYRQKDFSLSVEYTNKKEGEETFVGSYDIKLPANHEGVSEKVKVKVRINLHGIFLVNSASISKKEEVLVEEQEVPMEVDKKPAEGGAAPAEGGEGGEAPKEEDKPAADAKATAEAAAPKEPTKKMVSKTVELSVDARTHEISGAALNLLEEGEAGMAAADKLENDRINAKNAVEEYVYDTRSRLSEELVGYVAEADRESLGRLLTQTENWVYEEGEDCSKTVYVEKLEELRRLGEPIKERRRERQELPKAFESLMGSIQQASKACQLFREGHEQYNHLEEAEVEKVEKAVQEKGSWAEKQMGALNATPQTQDVPIKSFVVRSELTSFDGLVKPILTKPKPKPKAPTPPPADKTEPAPHASDAPSTNSTAATEQPVPEAPMDLD